MTLVGDRAELTAVVARARRRILLNHALSELVIAITITLVGPTLWLLLGTAWFTWPLLAVFALAGFGFAGWRFWRRRPAPYHVSQVLDGRLSTKDQISTAIHFLDSEQRPAVEQRAAAAKVASGSDVETAFPFAMPSSLYALASVFLVATALCALRYWLEKPLRIDQPLARVIWQAMGNKVLPRMARAETPQPQSLTPKQMQSIGLEGQSNGKNNLQQGQEAADPAGGASDRGDKSQRPENDPNGKGQNPSEQNGDEFGDPMASDQEQPIQSYEDMQDRDSKSGLSKAEGNQNKDSKGEENRAGTQEGSNSLLAKLRDAMNNMLSRMQQKSPGGSPQQQGAGSPSANGNEQKEGGGEGKGGAGQSKASGQESNDGEGADSEAQEQGAENQSGKGGKSSDQGHRGTSGDGAGKEEGDKHIVDAQQQDAMGKLSELYGRRAQNVTGEVTVETQGGKQTLRTPQGQSQARHSDSGGEINRDEIPLAYQAYVKEYFNKLRQPAKK